MLKSKLLIVLAICQIGLVGLGMARIQLLPATTFPGKLLRIYTGISGADNTYAFFAPGVRHQERVTFTLTDETGRTWQDDLNYGKSHEANLRLGSTANVLRGVDDETAFHFMRSMADTMFSRNPQAKTIKVQVQAYGIKLAQEGMQVPQVDFPTMDEYRQGKRPEWIDLYQITFKNDGQGHAIAMPEIVQVTK